MIVTWGGRRRVKVRGLTLIELLVVMAIIAVLAGLSVGVFRNAQSSARASSCMNNLRQIGAAVSMYVSDNDERFPTLVMARSSSTETSPALDTVLARYLRDTSVFACPEDYKHLAATTGTSYLWNTKLNGQQLGALSVSFLGMDPIRDTHRIMVLADKEGFHLSLANKINVLYADGHASKELTFVTDAP